MIIRIVRLTFENQKVPDFLHIFERSKEKIRGFAGCQYLALLKDSNEPNVYCTYSIWENEYALQRYRFSTLFKETWLETKQLFAAKPLAFSLQQVIELK